MTKCLRKKQLFPVVYQTFMLFRSGTNYQIKENPVSKKGLGIKNFRLCSPLKQAKVLKALLVKVLLKKGEQNYENIS